MNKSFLTPKELYESLIDYGKAKAVNSNINLFLLGILAGVYIGFAAHLATTIGTGNTEWIGIKKFMIGSVFSVGLMLVIIAGSELWTGNNLMVVALFQKKIKLGAMLRNWLIVYLGNFAGSILIAFIIAKSSGLLDGSVGGTAINLAFKKVTSEYQELGHNYAFFFRAVGCNWLVALAVILAMAAKDIGGKILAIFFPIMAFVASGFEHSIANMYFIPAGIFAKEFKAAVVSSGIPISDLTSLNWLTMWTHNIFVVTFGNFVGGSVMVGMFYWYIYLKPEQKLNIKEKKNDEKKTHKSSKKYKDTVEIDIPHHTKN